ncbi:MAG: hypothetical protein PWQ96_2258 [Clostridia bacterium]|nr:hypothetical protein [Clostridia bacterium]
MTQITKEINAFLSNKSIPELYMAYDWGNDNWRSGFKDIVAIEGIFRKNISKLIITNEAIMQIVQWGKLRNPKRVNCPAFINFTNEELSNPARMYSKLCKEINGLGPTYRSKIIRFACPQNAGAIDTRIVRVFGKGDLASVKYDWLDLKVVNYGYGWYINENQKRWPGDYFVWLNILTEIRDQLNNNDVRCSHPDVFVESGLREKGKWSCADVEIALFAYSSGIVR